MLEKKGHTRYDTERIMGLRIIVFTLASKAHVFNTEMGPGVCCLCTKVVETSGVEKCILL